MSRYISLYLNDEFDLDVRVRYVVKNRRSKRVYIYMVFVMAMAIFAILVMY